MTLCIDNNDDVTRLSAENTEAVYDFVLDLTDDDEIADYVTDWCEIADSGDEYVAAGLRFWIEE